MQNNYNQYPTINEVNNFQAKKCAKKCFGETVKSKKGDKMKKLYILVTLLLFLSACKTAPIYKPNGIMLPSNITKADAKEIILSTITNPGMSRKGWYVQETLEDKVVAGLDVRSHHAVIDINYDENAITPRLVSSLNLFQSNGNIHKNFNRWFKTLEKEIRINLQQKLMTKESTK